MKSITVKYFASVREAVGAELQMIQTEASSVQALKLELSRLSTGHAAALAHPRLCVALNQTMVRADAPLKSGDEVAFFPPVTGG